MKKSLLIITFVLLFIVLTAGCSNKTDKEVSVPLESEPTAEVSDSPEAINGETVSAEKFSAAVPEGWEFMEVDGGVMIYKNSGEIVQVYYRGENMNESEAQTQTEAAASQYSGTPAKEVELIGKTFWTTTYTASGTYQTSYMRIEDGVKLSIQCAGANHETDPDFSAILDSIVFK